MFLKTLQSGGGGGEIDGIKIFKGKPTSTRFECGFKPRIIAYSDYTRAIDIVYNSAIEQNKFLQAVSGSGYSWANIPNSIQTIDDTGFTLNAQASTEANDSLVIVAIR